MLDEYRHEPRIQRAAGLVLQQRDRALRTERPVIRPFGRDRVVVVDDGQDARADRDAFAREALRIALAVPSFVVAEDERRDRIRERHGGDDFRPDLRVNPDLLKLLLRQRARLRQDVLGDGELADVVQQRRGLDALDFVRRQARRLRQPGGVDLHAPDVRCASSGPSRRSPAPAPRSSRGGGRRSAAGRAAARPRCGPCRPCRSDRSGRAARRSAAPSSSPRCCITTPPAPRRRRRRNSWARSTESCCCQVPRALRAVESATPWRRGRCSAGSRRWRRRPAAAPAHSSASTAWRRRGDCRQPRCLHRDDDRRHVEHRAVDRGPIPLLQRPFAAMPARRRASFRGGRAAGAR